MKKVNSLTKNKNINIDLRLFLLNSFFMYFLIFNNPVYSNNTKNTYGSTTEVVYIYKMNFTGENTEYKGARVGVINGYLLVAILKRSYYNNNKSLVKSKYSSSKIHPGSVYGNPKIISNIYVEPAKGDIMTIEAKNLTNNFQEIPMNCEKKGQNCSIKTDTNLSIDLYVTEARWSNTNRKSSRSKYKIMRLKSEAAVFNKGGLNTRYPINPQYNLNPKYITFKHILINNYTKLKIPGY